MATYYVNALSGNDAAEGSRVAPWATLSKGFSGNGRTVMVATGMCYDAISNRQFLAASGTPKSSVTISAYTADDSPNDDYPVAECGFFEDATATGWTNLPGYGVWKKAFGSYQQQRVFAGAYGGPDAMNVLSTNRSIGEALRRATMPGFATNPNEATILAAINPYDTYFGGGSAAGYAVYVYTGRDDIPPPVWYGGLYIVGLNLTTAQGCGAGFDIVNAQGIHAEFLELRGAIVAGVLVRSGSGMGVTQDSTDILFSNIKVTASVIGVKTSMVITSTDPGVRTIGARFEHIDFDLMTNANEQEPDESYSFLSSLSNAFNLGNGSVNCSLYRCSAKNPGHKAYMILNSGFGYDVAPQSCVMSYCSATFDNWTTYGNWVSIKDGDNHVAHHNTCSGSTSRVELSGGVHFYKNEGVNFRISTRKPGTSGFALAISTGGYDWGNGLSGGLRYSNSSLTDVRAEQNTFEGVFTCALKYELVDDTAIQNGNHALFPSNKAVIKDNFIKGTFLGDVNHTITSRFLVVHNQYPAGFNFHLVQNNVTNIPSPNSTDECYTNYFEGGAMGDGTNPFAMNGMTGSTGNTAVSDPKVDSAMNPLPTSPLIGTATFIGYMPDIRGVQESNPPSKGARAYQAARTSRLT